MNRTQMRTRRVLAMLLFAGVMAGLLFWGRPPAGASGEMVSGSRPAALLSMEHGMTISDIQGSPLQPEIDQRASSRQAIALFALG